MRRILSLLALLMAFVVLLSACGKDEEPNVPDEENGTPEHTHAFGEWTTVTAATCFEDGQEKRSCTCGEEEVRVLAAAGKHIYTDGFCSLCGQSKDQHRLDAMTLKFENAYGKLYFDEKDGTVGYWDAQTKQIAFTNPVLEEAVAGEDYTVEELMAHVLFSYTRGDGTYKVNSYGNGVLTNQECSVQVLQNGIQINYGLSGQRILLPVLIEASAFEEKILAPFLKVKEENPDDADIAYAYTRFSAYYIEYDYLGAVESGDTERAEAIADRVPITKEKGINVYMLISPVSLKEMERLEGYIKTYCPAYTFEEMDKDYALVEYAEKLSTDFRTALVFTVGENGLTVDFAEKHVCESKGTVYPLPENGIFCYEGYQVLQVEILPYLKSFGWDFVTVLCP